MNQKAIGTYIAFKRKQKNYTQKELVVIINVSKKTVSKWGTGKCVPEYATIPALCSVLGITIAELLDGADAEQNSLLLYDEEQTLAQRLRVHRRFGHRDHCFALYSAIAETRFALRDNQSSGS